MHCIDELKGAIQFKGVDHFTLSPSLSAEERSRDWVNYIAQLTGLFREITAEDGKDIVYLIEFKMQRCRLRGQDTEPEIPI